eukprot:100056-Lingulodinium_polyedra.AAC.1
MRDAKAAWLAEGRSSPSSAAAAAATAIHGMGSRGSPRSARLKLRNRRSVAGNSSPRCQRLS